MESVGAAKHGCGSTGMEIPVQRRHKTGSYSAAQETHEIIVRTATN